MVLILFFLTTGTGRLAELFATVDQLLGALTEQVIAIYGPLIYTALYLMLLMQANPLRGQVGGGLGPVKWHRVPFQCHPVHLNFSYRAAPTPDPVK
jgi:hypothetical protein